MVNPSDVPVVITGVELGDVAAESGNGGAELTVAEWFLTTVDWTDASIGAGPLKSPGDARRPATLGPGEELLVSFTVHAAEDIEVGQSLTPKVVYAQEGRSGEATTELYWEIKVVPAGKSC